MRQRCARLRTLDVFLVADPECEHCARELLAFPQDTLSLRTNHDTF
ncbi:MAG: hypothetical protein P8Q92_16540 [Pseudoprimorskyibacter sp.]|nr:hypothetical protein [Pseudoprimorskyibacter sp.]